jgi:hypothetical protein|tara:strand:+ start:791 stop:1126 length:336 start_codon:yes stop_codon:yes gene_type:complete
MVVDTTATVYQMGPHHNWLFNPRVSVVEQYSINRIYPYYDIACSHLSHGRDGFRGKAQKYVNANKTRSYRRTTLVDNRRAVDNKLAAVINSYDATTAVYIMFVDLDHFKKL